MKLKNKMLSEVRKKVKGFLFSLICGSYRETGGKPRNWKETDRGRGWEREEGAEEALGESARWF